MTPAPPPLPPPSFSGPDAPRLPEAILAAAYGLLNAVPLLLFPALAAAPPRHAAAVLLGGLLPAAIALAAAGFRSAVSGAPLRAVLRLLPRPGRTAVLFFGAGVLAAIPLLGASALSAALCDALGIDGTASPNPLLVLLGPGTSPSVRLAMLLVALVLAPVGEELLYRALLYRGLAARLPRAALPLSAAFFAFLHLSPHHFLPLFLLALLLGIAFRRYGLAASAGLHAGFNGANLLAGILLV